MGKCHTAAAVDDNDGSDDYHGNGDQYDNKDSNEMKY